jgi:GTP-binding protein EngB required for normal cell division
MSLQSHETKDLLDIVDNLRSHGINRYINLPEIIVCGEQSSGKSSVLEAVSGVRFPSKDNLCTRFATELILRRGADAPIKIGIVPGSLERDRLESDLETLRNFHYSVSAENLDLEPVIEAAKEAMGIIEGSSKVFSSDILRLEISGPKQPHLTLVDLPGLFQAGSRSQSDADAETVKSLVLSYMKNPRSIILAVVSAKNDFNNQSITKYSRDIDPTGQRTLGLITKPDTLDEGSDSERFYFELAENKEVRFRLGWHVLRNRDFNSKDSSTEERDKAEARFFETGIWNALSVDQTGVHTLKPRLSKILKDHIVAQLPDVLAQIKDGINECTTRLKTLGASRASAQEQRRYLLHVSQSFSTLVRAAIDGQYSDAFFGDASTDEGYQKRLRAVLQNTLTDFAADMRKKGHAVTIVDDGPTKLPHQISRADYIASVTKLLERSRGRELPGTFDPLIIGQLFHEQRKPWPGLVDQYMEIVLRAADVSARKALAHVCDETTFAGLSRRFINVRLESLTAALRDKVAELLKPHDVGHPITYNHYLTENVQKAQSKRKAQEFKKSLIGVLGEDYSSKHAAYPNVDKLVDILVAKSEANMNSYASSTATDFMEAYYKVAQKRLIDDFAVLAIEARFIQELPSLFSPADVIDIDDATVAALASESEQSSRERTQFSEKLKILEDGLRALQAVQIISPLSQGTITLQRSACTSQSRQRLTYSRCL